MKNARLKNLDKSLFTAMQSIDEFLALPELATDDLHQAIF
jgi:hypothetical protein